MDAFQGNRADELSMHSRFPARICYRGFLLYADCEDWVDRNLKVIPSEIGKFTYSNPLDNFLDEQKWLICA